METKSPHLTETDILCWIDHELAEQRASEVREHLAGCEECRSRVAVTERALRDLMNVYRQERDTAYDRSAHQVRIPVTQKSTKFSVAPIRLIATVAAAVLVLCVAVRDYSGEKDAAAIPNVILTPGAISAVSKQQVCNGTVSANDPDVPEALKAQVLREYGLNGQSNRGYEIDYLVTPQLGGAVTIRNLWPQPALQTVWSARVKDQLEDRLHGMVCSGQLDLATAQRELSNDWVAAYKKYFGTQRPRTVS